MTEDDGDRVRGPQKRTAKRKRFFTSILLVRFKVHICSSYYWIIVVHSKVSHNLQRLKPPLCKSQLYSDYDSMQRIVY